MSQPGFAVLSTTIVNRETDLCHSIHVWIGNVLALICTTSNVCRRDRNYCTRRCSSRLFSLHLFLDLSKLLWVGGRGQNAEMSYSLIHPIILSGKHSSTSLCFLRTSSTATLLVASLNLTVYEKTRHNRFFLKTAISAQYHCVTFELSTVQIWERSPALFLSYDTLCACPWNIKFEKLRSKRVARGVNDVSVYYSYSRVRALRGTCNYIIVSWQ